MNRLCLSIFAAIFVIVWLGLPASARPFDVTVEMKTNLGKELEEPLLEEVKKELAKVIGGGKDVSNPDADPPADYRFAFEFRGRGSVGKTVTSQRKYESGIFHYWHSHIKFNGQYTVTFLKRTGDLHKPIDAWKGSFRYDRNTNVGSIRPKEKPDRDAFARRMKEAILETLAETAFEPAIATVHENLFPAEVQNVKPTEEKAVLAAEVKFQNRSPWIVTFACEARAELKRKMASGHHPSFSLPTVRVPPVHASPNEITTAPYTVAANPPTPKQREGTIVRVNVKHYRFVVIERRISIVAKKPGKKSEEVPDR